MSEPNASYDPTPDGAPAFWDARRTLPVWALGIAVAALVLLVAWGASQVNGRFVGSPVPTLAPPLANESPKHAPGGVVLPPRGRVMSGTAADGRQP